MPIRGVPTAFNQRPGRRRGTGLTAAEVAKAKAEHKAAKKPVPVETEAEEVEEVEVEEVEVVEAEVVEAEEAEEVEAEVEAEAVEVENDPVEDEPQADVWSEDLQRPEDISMSDLKADMTATAEAMGIDVKADWNKADIVEAIQDALAAGE